MAWWRNLCGAESVGVRVFVAPVRGLNLVSSYPGLTPWAIICRPSGADSCWFHSAEAVRGELLLALNQLLERSKNGDLPSSVSSRACLISEIAVARSISRVVRLPSGKGDRPRFIAHALVTQFMWRWESGVCELVWRPCGA